MLGLRARTLRGGIEDIRTDHVLGPPGDGAPLVDQAAAVSAVRKDQDAPRSWLHPMRLHVPLPLPRDDLGEK